MLNAFRGLTRKDTLALQARQRLPVHFENPRFAITGQRDRTRLPGGHAAGGIRRRVAAVDLQISKRKN